MDARIDIRPASFPDHWRSETPRAAVLACAFLALRAIRSGLGLVVLGLDQGSAVRHRAGNSSGPDLVCRDAAESAAMVAVFLVSGGADPPGADRGDPIGDRSAGQSVLATEQGTPGPGRFH